MICSSSFFVLSPQLYYGSFLLISRWSPDGPTQASVASRRLAVSHWSPDKPTQASVASRRLAVSHWSPDEPTHASVASRRLNRDFLRHSHGYLFTPKNDNFNNEKQSELTRDNIKYRDKEFIKSFQHINMLNMSSVENNRFSNHSVITNQHKKIKLVRSSQILFHEKLHLKNFSVFSSNFKSPQTQSLHKTEQRLMNSTRAVPTTKSLHKIEQRLMNSPRAVPATSVTGMVTMRPELATVNIPLRTNASVPEQINNATSEITATEPQDTSLRATKLPITTESEFFSGTIETEKRIRVTRAVVFNEQTVKQAKSMPLATAVTRQQRRTSTARGNEEETVNKSFVPVEQTRNISGEKNKQFFLPKIESIKNTKKKRDTHLYVKLNQSQTQINKLLNVSLIRFSNNQIKLNDANDLTPEKIINSLSSISNICAHHQHDVFVYNRRSRINEFSRQQLSVLNKFVSHIFSVISRGSLPRSVFSLINLPSSGNGIHTQERNYRRQNPDKLFKNSTFMEVSTHLTGPKIHSWKVRKKRKRKQFTRIPRHAIKVFRNEENNFAAIPPSDNYYEVSYDKPVSNNESHEIKPISSELTKLLSTNSNDLLSESRRSNPSRYGNIHSKLQQFSSRRSGASSSVPRTQILHQTRQKISYQDATISFPGDGDLRPNASLDKRVYASFIYGLNAMASSVPRVLNGGDKQPRGHDIERNTHNIELKERPHGLEMRSSQMNKYNYNKYELSTDHKLNKSYEKHISKKELINSIGKDENNTSFRDSDAIIVLVLTQSCDRHYCRNKCRKVVELCGPNSCTYYQHNRHSGSNIRKVRLKLERRRVLRRYVYDTHIDREVWQKNRKCCNELRNILKSSKISIYNLRIQFLFNLCSPNNIFIDLICVKNQTNLSDNIVKNSDIALIYPCFLNDQLMFVPKIIEHVACCSNLNNRSYVHTWLILGSDRSNDSKMRSKERNLHSQNVPCIVLKNNSMMCGLKPVINSLVEISGIMATESRLAQPTTSKQNSKTYKHDNSKNITDHRDGYRPSVPLKKPIINSRAPPNQQLFPLILTTLDQYLRIVPLSTSSSSTNSSDEYVTVNVTDNTANYFNDDYLKDDTGIRLVNGETDYLMGGPADNIIDDTEDYLMDDTKDSQMDNTVDYLKNNTVDYFNGGAENYHDGAGVYNNDDASYYISPDEGVVNSSTSDNPPVALTSPDEGVVNSLTSDDPPVALTSIAFPVINDTSIRSGETGEQSL